MLEICRRCPLYQHHGGLTQYVPATAHNIGSRYVIVGEAPGEYETIRGEPFVGPAGQEQNNYLSRANLSRDLFHIRNVVQCRPPKNRDPSPDEISCCAEYMTQYLDDNRPGVIVAVGRFAAQWFLGESLSMEYSHGIPYRPFPGGPVIIPVYHPAAGMRATTMMELIRQDYEAVGRTVRCEIEPRLWPPTVTTIECSEQSQWLDHTPDYIALDTETLPDGSAWCVTYSHSHGYSSIIMADDTENLNRLNSLVQTPGVVTVLHNSLFDLSVLESIGIVPTTVHDTMVMAYLLQDLPLGLKPLSYRLAGMTLRKYTEVIHNAAQEKALEYLLTASELTWPDPEHILAWTNGVPKVKRPQNISKKIKRLITAYCKDPTTDLVAKWKAIDIAGGRGQVESTLGLMPEASLADVPRSEAVQYACADADATYRIYPQLRDRIDQMGLWDTFHRDMAVTPVIAEMMSTGILINSARLHDLDKSLDIKKSIVEADINHIYPGTNYILPSSTQQVARALFDMGVYPKPNLSTDSKTLDLYRSKHPIVNLITRWRELDKLQTTYLRPLPQKSDQFGRIHTKFSKTTAITGRLASSNPNLQNIPVRTSEGRAIRSAFVASPGCSLVSLDYSQIEMRCIAHESQDPTMIRMFLDDLDIHSETAARMFKIPLSEVDKNTHRRPAKSVGFGVAYGMGAVGLQAQMRAQGVEYTREECQSLIDSWYGVYPKIYEYMDCLGAEARRDGLVRDHFGRYRLVPEVISTIPRIVHAGIRQAGNFPIQSMAQQIIKQAMINLIPIYTALRQGDRYRCHILIQIHDELVWEISEEIVQEAVDVIRATMESAVTLCIPTPVDYNTGQTWEELK